MRSPWPIAVTDYILCLAIIPSASRRRKRRDRRCGRSVSVSRPSLPKPPVAKQEIQAGFCRWNLARGQLNSFVASANNGLTAGTCRGMPSKALMLTVPAVFLWHLVPAETQEPRSVRKNAAAASHAQAAPKTRPSPPKPPAGLQETKARQGAANGLAPAAK